MRAVFGKRSGPMTISATTAMTTISEKPISNMGSDRCARPARCRPFAEDGLSKTSPRAARLSHFLGRLLAYFALDRLTGHLRWRLRRRRTFGVRFGALHPFLESLDRAAQVLTDVPKL